MLRTIHLAVSAVFWTMLIAPVVITVALVNSSSARIDALIRFWARRLVAAAGIRLSAEHLDRIEPARRYILIANHNSYLDIPCLLAAIPQPLRFMAKVSLFKIPVFGTGLRAAGFIPIDRKNRAANIQSFSLAADRIRRGNSIVVFPEEGRSHSREMRPFQRGAFLLALKSALPIVPVAITGTHEVLPPGRHSVHPGPVVVRVGTPIETSKFSIRTKDQLATETRAAIEEMLS